MQYVIVFLLVERKQNRCERTCMPLFGHGNHFDWQYCSDDDSGIKLWIKVK